MGLFDFFRRRRGLARQAAEQRVDPFDDAGGSSSGLLSLDGHPSDAIVVTRASRGPVWFEGGAGETIDDAVLILGAPSHGAGVRAEYDWLTQKYGTPGKDWTLVNQALVQPGGRPYDQMCVRLDDGTMKVIFFDLSDCFGRRS